jgi:RHS repeat-associated protein
MKIRFNIALMNLLILMVFNLLSVSSSASEQVIYYHNDLQGSPIAATDEKGDLLWRERYLPYGERQIDEDGVVGVPNSRWFTGHVEDEETGLIYMQARYYDPSIGRFLSVDPVGTDPTNHHSFNRYAYANNNPYKYVDPDGEYAESWIEIASIAAGVVSMTKNYAVGNYVGMSVDGIGIVADGVALAIPGVPGGAGIGIKASREAAERVTKSADTRVGRWMSPGELSKMKSTGAMQEGSGGLTFVANSGASSFRKQAKPGSQYVEFDVATNSLLQGGKSDWFKTLGQNAPKSQLFKLNKQGGQVNPPIRNLSNVIETK